MLVLGEDFYMNTGFTGWVKASLDDFGADSDSLKKLMEGHAPLDYEQLVKDVGGEVQNGGDVTVDGKTYTELTITTDFEKLLAAIGNSVGDSGLDTSDFPADISGPMTIEILIDKETLLPYTFEANGQFGMGEDSMNFSMTFQVLQLQRPGRSSRRRLRTHSRSRMALATCSETPVPTSNRSLRRRDARPDHHSRFPLAILAWIALTSFGR